MLQIGSSREKNVEVRVMLVASNDSLKKLTPGGATDPTAETSTTYKSTVYYHKNSPRWGEMIKIDIPTECGNAHLRFHFMLRTSELRFNALQRWHKLGSLNVLKFSYQSRDWSTSVVLNIYQNQILISFNINQGEHIVSSWEMQTTCHGFLTAMSKQRRINVTQRNSQLVSLQGEWDCVFGDRVTIRTWFRFFYGLYIRPHKSINKAFRYPYEAIWGTSVPYMRSDIRPYRIP